MNDIIKQNDAINDLEKILNKQKEKTIDSIDDSIFEKKANIYNQLESAENYLKDESNKTDDFLKIQLNDSNIESTTAYTASDVSYYNIMKSYINQTMGKKIIIEFYDESELEIKVGVKNG